MAAESFQIAAATQADAERIVGLLNENKEDPSMFVRSIEDVSKNISDFIVLRSSDDLTVGCAALHQHTPSEAEILSVAISPTMQGNGLGSMLTKHCITMASERNAVHLWLATVKPAYFSRFGFVPFVRWRLPTAVLLHKLGQVFQQPVVRWAPAIFGQFAFMEHRENEAVA